MVVSIDKFTAVRMYEKVQHYWKEEIKELNKLISIERDEVEKKRLRDIVNYMKNVDMAVVISMDNSEEEEKKFEKEGLSIKPHVQRMNFIDENGFDIEDNFKDPTHPLQLVFVCAMWLTGFDAPSVSTLYLDKPMKGHTLMQTIARANRVFGNKECGLVIDHINVFKHLKKALVDYASNDNLDIPVKDIDTLFGKLNECIDVTCEFCKSNNAELKDIIDEEEIFKNIENFENYANTLIGNDEVKNEFQVMANTVENISALKCISVKPVQFWNILFIASLLAISCNFGKDTDGSFEQP